MCGLCGVVGFPPGPGRDALVSSMAGALAHRGPDDAATWGDGDVAFGFRRLAIIDPAGGRQPMANDDGSLHLILNGEIYNHRELRQGRRFRTRSDVEAALRVLEEEGPAGLARLHGMFALALWNSRDRSLLLARDRHGKKPLVYWTDGRRFAFASEIQALLRIPEVERESDPESIGSYLTTGVVPAPRTMFRSIRKLPPGHYAVLRAGRLELHPLPKLPAPAQFPDRESARAWVRAEVTRAVEARLESDAPLGAFLSGGVDSTLIVGLMSKKGPVSTFTAAFDDPELDESATARIVSKRFGTRHREIRIAPEAGSLLPTLAAHFGEPFADPAAIPMWELSRGARETVKSALSGDGGDECFGGYLRYRALRLLKRLRGLPAALRWMAFLAPVPARYRNRARSLIGRSSLPLAELYAEMLAPIEASVRSRLYPGPEPAIEEFDGDDPVAAASARDIREYLPHDLLVKTDIASMAHGLEVRCPFVDATLVAGSAAIPGEWKIEGRTTKAILRDAFRDLLPPEVLSGRKRGLGIPLDAWLRGPLRTLRDDHLRDRGSRIRSIFDAAEIDRLVREQDQGAANGRALWTLMMFEAWKRWIETS